MTIIRTIAQNTASLAVADIVNKLASFGLTILIARLLGDRILGTYSFALAFIFFFTLVADFGISKLLIRQIARDRESAGKEIGTAAAAKILLSLAVFLGFALTVHLIGYPPETVSVLYIFGAALLGNTFANTFRSVFFAFEQVEYEAAMRGAEKVLTLALSAAAILMGYGIIGVAWAFLGVAILDVLASAIIVFSRFARFRLSFDLPTMRQLLATAWPFLLVNFFFLVYFKVDLVMLAFMKGDVFAGWYNAAYQIIEGLLFIPVIFMSVMFPVMSRFAVSHLPSLQASVRKSLFYLLVAALPIAVGSILLGRRIIPLLYGSQFGESVVALQVLMAALVFAFVIRPLSAALVTVEKQKLNLWIMIGASVLNISLNLAFIPALAHVGAAISTVISEIALFAIYVYCYRKYVGNIGMAGSLGKLFAANGALGIVIFLLRDAHLAAAVGAAAAAYLALILGLRVFTRQDLADVREALHLAR